MAAMRIGLAGREPVRASAEERDAVERLHAALEEASASRPRLIGPDGQQLELPDSVFQVLTRVVHELAQGHAVSVMPIHAELTTQQAAELLGVSRPHLIKLLGEKQIPYDRPSKHRRIRLSDVLEYKELRDTQRRAALDQMRTEDERLGLRYA